MEERSGNMLVKNMVKQIRQDVEFMGYRYPSKRVLRQSKDAADFLNLISKPPYSRCKTVSDLKKKISEERNKLKNEVISLDKYLPGHQFTLFENVEDLTEDEKRKVDARIAELNIDIRFLHKCLGMCSNQEYFK